MHSNKIVFTGLLLLSTLVSLSGDIHAQQALAGGDDVLAYRKMGYILLSGEQNGQYEPQKYLVVKEMTVPRNESLTFMPGSIIFLMKDARISVEGTLICQGNAEGGVIFTRFPGQRPDSSSDTGSTGTWDGIYVSETGKAELNFTNIRESRSGINANSRLASVILFNSVFSRNDNNLSIAGAPVKIKADEQVSFKSLSLQPDYAVIRDEKIDKADTVSGLGRLATVDATPKSSSSWYTPVRWSCAVVAFAGIGGSGYVSYRWWQEDKQYNKLCDAAKNRAGGPTEDEKKAIKNQRNLRDRYKKYSIISLLPVSVGLFGFYITYPLSK